MARPQGSGGGRRSEGAESLLPAPARYWNVGAGKGERQEEAKNWNSWEEVRSFSRALVDDT
jgi:hypothetical protein